MTALQAITSIAIESRAPVGIVFGTKDSLCVRRQRYRTDARDPMRSLSEVVRGTGYKVSAVDGVFNIVALDISHHERRVLKQRLPGFVVSLAPMNEIGRDLTSYLHAMLEGAKAYSGGGGVGMDDELVRLPLMKHKTVVEISNEAVSFGRKGLWTIQSNDVDRDTKLETTTVNMYSYHNDLRQIGKLACPVMRAAAKP